MPDRAEQLRREILRDLPSEEELEAALAPLSPLDTMELRVAEADHDPKAMLGALRRIAKRRPGDLIVAQAVTNLAAKLDEAPAIILMERIKSAGRSHKLIEGCVYIEEPDGRLRPASGEDLRVAEKRFPGFLKNWRLPEDEY